MTAPVAPKRKANGRALAKAQTARAVVVSSFAPLSFAKREPEAEAERIPLFEIDGTEYTIPAVVPTGDALAYLLVASSMANEAQRGAYLMRELAGPDALTALLGQADMRESDWHKLIKILSEHAFGHLEAPGN